MSPTKIVVRPLGLEDLIDRLVTENYIEVSKEDAKELSREDMMGFLQQGYLLFDLGKLFPYEDKYKKNLYFIPLEVIKYKAKVEDNEDGAPESD